MLDPPLLHRPTLSDAGALTVTENCTGSMFGYLARTRHPMMGGRVRDSYRDGGSTGSSDILGDKKVTILKKVEFERAEQNSTHQPVYLSLGALGREDKYKFAG